MDTIKATPRRKNLVFARLLKLIYRDKPYPSTSIIYYVIDNQHISHYHLSIF